MGTPSSHPPPPQTPPERCSPGQEVPRHATPREDGGTTHRSRRVLAPNEEVQEETNPKHHGRIQSCCLEHKRQRMNGRTRETLKLTETFSSATYTEGSFPPSVALQGPVQPASKVASKHAGGGGEQRSGRCRGAGQAEELAPTP